MRIPKKLEEVRKKMGLNKTEFSNLIGTTPSSYSHIINGRRLPTTSLLEQIAKSTNTDIREWIDLLEEDKREKVYFEYKPMSVEYKDWSSGTGNLAKGLLDFYKNKYKEANIDKFFEEHSLYNLEAENEKREVNYKRLINNKDEDSCYKTLELLIEIGKITSPNDIDNDPTVRDMILTAAKKEVEKLLKDKKH